MIALTLNCTCGASRTFEGSRRWERIAKAEWADGHGQCSTPVPYDTAKNGPETAFLGAKQWHGVGGPDITEATRIERVTEVYRDAGTGEFVGEEFAEQHPATTETVERPRRRRR